MSAHWQGRLPQSLLDWTPFELQSWQSQRGHSWDPTDTQISSMHVNACRLGQESTCYWKTIKYRLLGSTACDDINGTVPNMHISDGPPAVQVLSPCLGHCVIWVGYTAIT